MRSGINRQRLLVVLTIFLVIQLVKCAPVNGFAAIEVYDHGFSKTVLWTSRGHVLVNRTSTFTQDDRGVWAYVVAAYYNATLTWDFYDPSGQLYFNRTNSEQCDVAPCTSVSFIPIHGTAAATKFGTWTLELLDEGFPVFTDHFSITPIITEEDQWTFNVSQSLPHFTVHGDLTVTIHPDNGTWSYYKMLMPYATNVTAFEASSNRTLNVTRLNDTSVIVNFGAPQSDGFSFVIDFDIIYGWVALNGWAVGVNFAFTWQDFPWQRSFTVHPVPESFTIELPVNSTFTELTAFNTMAIDRNVTTGPRTSVAFATTLLPWQRFGWTIIYRELSAIPQAPTVSSTTMALSLESQTLPVLPLTLGDVSLWTAIMSVFLLTGSELLSPIYGRTGIMIDRRRLRIAALILVAIFLVTTAYQLIAPQLAIAH
jgi:hypothetical protein